MVAEPSPFAALESAIDILGSQAELARVCRVSSTAVWKWCQSTKRLPAEFVLDVERASGISRHHLRPDIYPRGLVDGMPYEPEEPTLDVFTSVTFPPRAALRDRRTDDPEARMHGVDQRTRAQL